MQLVYSPHLQQAKIAEKYTERSITTACIVDIDALSIKGHFFMSVTASRPTPASNHGIHTWSKDCVLTRPFFHAIRTHELDHFEFVAIANKDDIARSLLKRAMAFDKILCHQGWNEIGNQKTLPCLGFLFPENMPCSCCRGTIQLSTEKRRNNSALYTGNASEQVVNFSNRLSIVAGHEE